MKGSLARAHKHIPEYLEMTGLFTEACEDAKGENIQVYDMMGNSDIARYFVIASGRSDRQVQGIAQRILSSCDKHDIEVLSVEGIEKSHWVLIDTGDVVVHLFYDPVRSKFDLEGLWGERRLVNKH